MIRGSTHVPLRFVGEATGGTVDYRGSYVDITDPSGYLVRVHLAGGRQSGGGGTTGGGGYIASWTVEDAEVGKTLTITLKYGNNRERSIAGVRRISKPGLRVYAKSTGLPKVLGGLGIAIISTSQGLLTDSEANAKSVGGEVLAYVW